MSEGWVGSGEFGHLQGLKKGGLEGGEFESTGWGSDLGRQGLCQGAGSQPTTGCGQERRKEKKENLRGWESTK